MKQKNVNNKTTKEREAERVSRCLSPGCNVQPKKKKFPFVGVIDQISAPDPTRR